MIELLPFCKPIEGLPSIYDVKSLTTIEMISKVYGKTNELVNDYNSFVKNVNNIVKEFLESQEKDAELFKIAIRQEFQNFINIVELQIKSQNSNIDEKIKRIYDDEIKENLNSTVDEKLNTTIREELEERLSNSINDIVNEAINATNANLVKKSELEALSSIVNEKASKEELNLLSNAVNNNATKEELNNLSNEVNSKATKEELNNLSDNVDNKATKEELKALSDEVNEKATKEELKSVSDELLNVSERHLKSKLVIESLITATTINSTTKTINTYNSRKFSDYDAVIITLSSGNLDQRVQSILPRPYFANTQLANHLQCHSGTSGETFNMSKVYYVNDTQINATLITGALNVINVFGIRSEVYYE